MKKERLYSSFDIRKRKCPQCGKTHYPDLDNHVFVRTQRVKTKERRLYLCSWSCLQAYDKALEEKRAARKRKTYDPTGMHCIDCRYCKEDELGYRCTTYSQLANIERNACRRFKPKGDK